MENQPTSGVSGKGIQPVTSVKRPLPSLNDLYGNIEQAYEQNELNRLLNADPLPEWIKKNPMAEGSRYIPIGVIEAIMTRIFIKWRVEVKQVQVIGNSAVVTVRLWVQDPLTMEWDWQEGIGAAPIHTKKGAPAADFNQVLTDSVMKAAPSAESYAVKDAAEKLGRIFGKDLNRKDVLAYTGLDGKIDLDKIEASPEQMRELYDLLNAANISHDEHDEYREKFAGGISKDAYKFFKRQLSDLEILAIDKVRNGDNVSASEMKLAVKSKADDES